MFNRWILPVILLALSAAAYGQSVSPSGSGSAPQSGSGAPTNPCAQALALYINTANGDLYTCPSAGGNWVKWPSAGATPSAGSAGNLQYAGAGNTFAGSPDFNVTSHTLAGGASAIFDMHLAATSGLFLPGGLSTGLLRVTTSTGAIASSELSGDCTTSGSNATTCTKTSGSPFVASAIVDTTQAGNITGGLLGLAEGGAHANLSATGGAHFVLQQSTVGGNISVARLACSDLSDSVASCSIDTTNASNITSGTLAAARLPNPSASTLGGIQSFAAVSNQWIRSISTSGVPAASQPNFTDLAGNIAVGQITALSTNNSILIRDNTGALTQITATSIGLSNCVGVNGSPLQFTGLTCAGGSGGANGVNAKTANYTLASGDNAKNVTFNGTSLTATLPASPPSATWTSWIENLNPTTNVTVTPNGLTVNGSSSSITLGPFQSVYVWTDNTNYFATGLPVLAGSGLLASYSALGLSLSLNTAVALTNANASAGKPWSCVSSNGTTAYTCTIPAAVLTAYTAQQFFLLNVDTTCATSCNVNMGPGAISIKKSDGATDPGGALIAGQSQWAYYDGTVFRLLGGGGSGSSTAFQVNTSALTSSATVNFLNSAATNGLTLTFTNTSAGNIQLGFTGTLSNAGLANSATTVAGQTCTLGSTCSIASTSLSDTANLLYTNAARTLTAAISVGASGSIAPTSTGTITATSMVAAGGVAGPTLASNVVMYDGTNTSAWTLTGKDILGNAATTEGFRMLLYFNGNTNSAAQRNALMVDSKFTPSSSCSTSTGINLVVGTATATIAGRSTDGTQPCSLTVGDTSNSATTFLAGALVSLVSTPLSLSGNLSSAAWTTNGIRIKGVSGTMTDTTSSGTVATAYTDVLGGNTIAASSSSTFTNYYALYVKASVAGTNVALTNAWGFGADSIRVGTSNQFTVSATGAVGVAGQITSTVTTGTAPLVVASTTQVANLNASSIGGFNLGTPVAGGIGYGVSTTQIGTTSAFVAKQLILAGGTGAPTAIDLPDAKYIPAANCNNVSPGAGWSIGSGGTVTCRAGTNNLGGYVTITDTSSTFAQFSLMLPEDWDTATDPYIRVYFSAASDTTNGHTVIPQVKVSCPTAANGTTSDDATFSAAQSLSTTTFGGSAVANGFYNSSNVQIGATQMTGCIAGGLMIVQVGRATDSATGAINFYGATVTIPRLPVVQAN